MKINVEIADGGTANASVTLDDGTPLMGVERIQFDLRGDEPARAELTFWLPKISLKSLPVSVSEKHLRELADSHGFDLVKKS